MAKLIKCKDCGQKISKKAKKCSNCGAPTKRRPIGCGGAIVILIVVAGLASILQSPDPSIGTTTVSTSNYNPRVSSVKEERWAWKEINIRSKRSTDSKVVKQTEAGEKLYVGGLENGWWSVYSSTSGNRYGYVADSVVHSAPQPDEANMFSTLDEEIYDAPIKTQIEQHVLAKAVPTEVELKAELVRRYHVAKKRGGFIHHNHPTNIYIYVYGTEEQATAGKGLWIGMLAYVQGDNNDPGDITINEGRLAALNAPAESRFGLTEQKRKRLFKELFAVQIRSTREAQERIPDPKNLEEIQVQAKLEKELDEKYSAILMQEYELDSDQLREVTLEGLNKGWAH